MIQALINSDSHTAGPQSIDYFDTALPPSTHTAHSTNAKYLSPPSFQMIHPVEKDARLTPDFRFVREPRGGLTITNVMLEDNGKWQCEAENAHGYSENARPVKLVVLGKCVLLGVCLCRRFMLALFLPASPF